MKQKILSIILMLCCLFSVVFLFTFLITNALADEAAVYYYYNDTYISAEDAAEILEDLVQQRQYWASRQQAAHDMAEASRFLYPDEAEDSHCVLMAKLAWHEAAEQLKALTLPEELTAQEVITRYLQDELSLNRAVVCGILGNLYEESHLSPEARSGSNCVGIAQWTGSRYTDLTLFCAESGYEATSMQGQLAFLVFELQNGYSPVYEALLDIEDSAAGAQEAAKIFCRRFEIPLNTEYQSTRRAGNALAYYNS